MREPAIHKKRDGHLFVASDGSCFFLDPWWFAGAKIAFAAAIVGGWLAWHVWRLLPARLALGRFGLAILPSAGDWIYHDNGGRCESLAMFIDCELITRGLVSRRTV